MASEQVAFGRLIGRIIFSEEEFQNIDILVKTLPSTLGRADTCDVCLNMNNGSDANTISREHAIIKYVNNTFTIKCLSKNGCMVDKKLIEKHDEALLKPKTSIKLGNAYIYWLPARKISRQSSGSRQVQGIYGKLVSAAIIESEPLKTKMEDKDVGATQRDIIDVILVMNPELNADEMGDGHKFIPGSLYSKNKNLIQGVYNHLKNNYGAIKSGNHKDPIRYYITDNNTNTDTNIGPPSKKSRTETQTGSNSAPLPAPAAAVPAAPTAAAVDMEVTGSTSERV